MAMSDATLVTASPIVTIALPQCTIATLPYSCHIQMFASQQTSLQLVMPLTLFRPVGLGVSRVVYVLLISSGLPQSRGDMAIWGVKDEDIASINFRYSSSCDESITYR